ncbi:sterol reductase [Chloropicon primus]|uniref:Delta(14)-sterol reductase ERG24 n=3 Tax=Chloropicon primus TaxID=1764295 RepID=A0A5B8MMJ2_9CHLO|nr:sterol reductase [Chloropicon primus]UPR00987.1 sterol reductase [Chloropicon primus]|eukprot:QDZ21766.1 sterol reductase [Chloropicon primus]
MVTTRRQAAAGSGNGDAPRGSRTKKDSSKSDVAGRHPDHVEYEFFGPILGPIGIVVGLPAVMFGLYGFCGKHGCVSLKPFEIPEVNIGDRAISFEGFLVYLGWIFGVALLHLVLPSSRKLGVSLANGKRLEYRMNGLLVYATTLLLVYALVADWDWPQKIGLRASMLGYVYDHYVELISASVVCTLLFSIALYLASFRSKSVLCAKGGDTGSRIYDFFIGRELNPRIGSFDLKEFCELYPGLIGWVVIDLAMAYKQHEIHGSVSNSMAMVCLFHAIYVADALYYEKSILTTMDIVHDGFGFMLAFGDLAWVPFTYTVQARYLVDHPIHLSRAFLAVVLALKIVGYLAFRGANGQKDMFRRDPNSPKVKHIKYIKTKRGTRLMVSGWWGIARHINYTADWIMGLSWCLPCGFDHVVPYFYAIYFGVLLIHRDLRDGEACENKYGSDWDKYCNVVKYRLIPFVY